MADTLRSWGEVVAFALSLPDTSLESFYGTPCPKVNRKAFVSPGREPDSFHVMSPHDEKAVLIETDPDTFWQSDHYRNYPSVLARFGTDARERIVTYLHRAWWDRATKAQREGFGDRP